MRPLFDEVLLRLEPVLEFELKIGTAYVGLLHRLVFAALHVQAKKIVVEFTLRKEISSRRIVTSKQFQKSRWAYYVAVTTPASSTRSCSHGSRTRTSSGPRTPRPVPAESGRGRMVSALLRPYAL